MNGLSDVIGSWKIIAMRLPRIRAHLRVATAPSRSWPSNRISPETMRPGGDGISRMIDRLVTDLPEPDSPTMPERFAAPQRRS